MAGQVFNNTRARPQPLGQSAAIHFVVSANGWSTLSANGWSIVFVVASTVVDAGRALDNRCPAGGDFMPARLTMPNDSIENDSGRRTAYASPNGAIDRKIKASPNASPYHPFQAAFGPLSLRVRVNNHLMASIAAHAPLAAQMFWSWH